MLDLQSWISIESCSIFSEAWINTAHIEWYNSALIHWVLAGSQPNRADGGALKKDDFKSRKGPVPPENT